MESLEILRKRNFQGRPKHNHNHNFQKSFASGATPKWHLMPHQMKNLRGFSVFHCAEGAFGASSGGTPKMKNGAPRGELKNGRGRGWAAASICKKNTFHWVRKGCGKFAEISCKFWTHSCSDPFPNDPTSELLKRGKQKWGPGGGAKRRPF